jgi:hypothetical protein
MIHFGETAMDCHPRLPSLSPASLCPATPLRSQMSPCAAQFEDLLNQTMTITAFRERAA